MELEQITTARGHDYTLGGHYEVEFQPVIDAFIENFNVEDEIGAACSIIHEGRTVVDIWGGWRNGGMDDPGTRRARCA